MTVCSSMSGCQASNTWAAFSSAWKRDGAGIGVLLKLALQIMFVEALVEFLEDELGVRIHEAAAMLKAGAVVMVG